MSSSQDYFDFFHDRARSEKRYVVACAKTYDNTGTYISLKIFKKENGDNEFRFNQKLTLSLQELEQVGENIDAIRRIALSEFANEQSSSGKRKLQPCSSLETNAENCSCRFKKSKKPQRVIKRINWQMKMVEAMCERTPEYIRQFQKLFRYFICNSEPQFDSNLTKNFA